MKHLTDVGWNMDQKVEQGTRGSNDADEGNYYNAQRATLGPSVRNGIIIIFEINHIHTQKRNSNRQMIEWEEGGGIKITETDG